MEEDHIKNDKKMLKSGFNWLKGIKKLDRNLPHKRVKQEAEPAFQLAKKKATDRVGVEGRDEAAR